MSDLISRQAAVVALANNRCGNDEWDLAVTHDVETIKRIPSAEPERKPGKWINIDGSTNTADCSCCGNRGRAWMNYCYECGAKMKDGVTCNVED